MKHHFKKYSEFINEEMTSMQTSKYSNKEYYCPVCGNKEIRGTNHNNEIYVPCKKCHNTPLYSVENDLDSRPFITATIHFYDFNLDDSIRRDAADTSSYFNRGGKTAEEEKQEYNELVSRLKGQGYEKFTVYDRNGYQQFEALKKHDGEEIKLYDPEQFDNQYVSDIGRIFNWFEMRWDNKTIKSGYYLDINK